MSIPATAEKKQTRESQPISGFFLDETLFFMKNRRAFPHRQGSGHEILYSCSRCRRIETKAGIMRKQVNVLTRQL